MMERLKTYGSNLSSLLEVDGKWSAMRFMSMFAVIVPILVWAVISIVNWNPAQLPAELSAIVLFGLGGKALQSKYEIRNARESINDLMNMGKPIGSEYNNENTMNSDNDIPDNYYNYTNQQQEIPEYTSETPTTTTRKY